MEKERAGCVHLTIARVFSVARLAGADSALGINEHGEYMEETVCRMGQARAKWQWATLRGVARESPSRSGADAQAEQPAGVRPAYGLPSFPLPPMSSTRLFPGPPLYLINAARPLTNLSLLADNLPQNPGPHARGRLDPRHAHLCGDAERECGAVADGGRGDDGAQ
jgi:hypothetical protein